MDSFTSDPMKQRKKKAPKAPEKKKLRPLYRFRAAVRRVIANMDWLVMEEDEEEEEGADSDLAKLNRIMLRSRKSDKKSLLCAAEKTILLKDASERTDEEKRRICFVIGGLRCFRLYPEDVRAQLAASTYFMYYHANREVVRQGHAATGLYFILEGKVDVYINIPDPLTEVLVPKFVGNMEGGDMFGEVSLLHGIPRTATIITATDCNLLCLRKDDFDTVLKSSLMKQWDECKAAMNAFPYFDGLNDVSVRECCILSKMRVFPALETVLGSGCGEPGYVHFVLTGQVQVMELLRLAVRRAKGLTNYRYYEEGKGLKPGERLEGFFVRVCLLQAGSCFGLGEERYGRTLIASEPTLCLLCPRYWIMQNNKANIWDRVINFYNLHIPSSRQLFEDFQEQRKWLRYRKSLVKEILRGKPRKTMTSIHDVPYSLRMKEHVQFDRPGQPMSLDHVCTQQEVSDFEMETRGDMTVLV